MADELKDVFSKKKKLKLMTHVLAGYPDLKTSQEWIMGLAESGADLIEIQIPFSDPLADGPTIMAANHLALKNGITPQKCFELARSIKGVMTVPFIFMTYANIAYAMGIERFVSLSAESGASGLIMPDLPFDERNFDLFSCAKKYGLPVIPVVSAGISSSRLKKILNRAEGFLYITLRVGITGAVKRIEREGLEFIQRVRGMTSLPLAAGFGLSSEKHLDLLQGKVDMAVIGSHLIDLFHSGGLRAVLNFIKRCKARTRRDRTRSHTYHHGIGRLSQG